MNTPYWIKNGRRFRANPSPCCIPLQGRGGGGVNRGMQIRRSVVKRTGPPNWQVIKRVDIYETEAFLSFAVLLLCNFLVSGGLHFYFLQLQGSKEHTTFGNEIN